MAVPSKRSRFPTVTFAVVNFNYRLAPEFKHPVPLEDTNKVFYWILNHADTYGLDTENISAFIMPVKIIGNELELRFFREAVASIKNQTDTDWIIIMVDDDSDDPNVYHQLEAFKEDLKDKLHIIYSDKNYGAGAARNKAIQLNEQGFPRF